MRSLFPSRRMSSSPRSRLLLRGGVLAGAVLFLTGFFRPDAAGAAEQEPGRPNVLVIVSDDQGWKDIGYHGSEISTPHLDRLARAGVRLNQYYVYPTCSPTRAGILAGRNPSRYRILGPIGGTSRHHLPTETVTLADTLQSAGYHTALSGKWHLGLRPEVGPKQYGFESTYGYLHGQIDPYTHRYKYGDRTWHRNDKLQDEEGHATDLLTAEAVRVIEQQREQPFFLYVAYSVPHHPLKEPEQWEAPYRGKIEDQWRRLFAASVTHMDDGVGQMVAALERTGQTKNTVIIFTSDNGGQQSWSAPDSMYEGRYEAHTTLGNNLPLKGWKGSVYEGGIRVPAFVTWPGTLQPGELDSPASMLDWYPTVAGFCGVSAGLPEDLEGRDLGPQLRGEAETAETERAFYWHTGRDSALRSGDLKLIVHHARSGKGETVELYDIAHDLKEQHNLAGKQPEDVARLRKLLLAQQEQDQREQAEREARSRKPQP
ncbi:MAG: sulfatase-like hydrolase/transferase [Planctomycetaceae bacterium]|nr:sulfatase-like hydrolase/transferase [Planctomycetaceae bacterium]